MPEDTKVRLFIADADDARDKGYVHVFDTEHRRKIRSLGTNYNPDIAVSRSGDRLALVHSALKPRVTEHALVLFDTTTFRPMHNVLFEDRFLYNVCPTSSTVLFS